MRRGVRLFVVVVWLRVVSGGCGGGAGGVGCQFVGIGGASGGALVAACT